MYLKEMAFRKLRQKNYQCKGNSGISQNVCQFFCELIMTIYSQTHFESLLLNQCFAVIFLGLKYSHENMFHTSKPHFTIVFTKEKRKA